MANIIVTAHYTLGDVLPFLKLCKRLKERGHCVTLVTHGAYMERAREAGIGFEALDSPGDYDRLLKDIGTMGDPVNDPGGYAGFHDRYCGGERLLYEYGLIARHCMPEDTVIVARHGSGAAAYLASEKLGRPVVPVFLAPSYIHHLAAQDELTGEYQVKALNPVRSALGLPPAASWYRWMCSVGDCIGFWPDWFSGRDSYAPFSVTAAGFAFEESGEKGAGPGEAEAFIAGGEAPILITGGTSMLLRANFYKVAAEACRLLGHRALLVCRHKELVPEELPEFIRWYEFLPLEGIFHRMKLVVHHGGIGTIGGAAFHSVPQLALAADTDRPDNAMRLREAGIGAYLPPIQWEPDLIAERLKALMSPEVKHRCAAVSAGMKAAAPFDTACGVIERAVGNSRLTAAAGEERQAGRLAAPDRLMEAAGNYGAGNGPAAESLNGLSREKKAFLLYMLKKKSEGGLNR